MPQWSNEEFFDYMDREPWFSAEAIAAAESIMDWAGKQKNVSTSWSGEKVPIFNALAGGKRFISVMAKKGWDIEIPFYDRGYLLTREKNQQAIQRLERMGVETVNPDPLSPDHRRAIRLDSIKPCLEEFLELLSWIVNEIYAQNKLV